MFVKKILMLAERMQPGNGVSDYCGKLSSILSENGYEVHIAFFSGSDYTERIGNIYKHGISFVLHGNNLFTWAMMMNNELKRRGREIFNEHGFDVIHANDWLTTPAGIAMKKLTGKPLLVTIHSTENERGFSDPQSPSISDIEWWACYEAAKVLVSSQRTFHSIKNDLGVPAEKIDILKLHDDSWQERVLDIYSRALVMENVIHGEQTAD